MYVFQLMFTHIRSLKPETKILLDLRTNTYSIFVFIHYIQLLNFNCYLGSILWKLNYEMQTLNSIYANSFNYFIKKHFHKFKLLLLLESCSICVWPEATVVQPVHLTNLFSRNFNAINFTGINEYQPHVNNTRIWHLSFFGN